MYYISITKEILKIEDIEDKIDKTQYDYTQYINTDVTPNVKYDNPKEYKLKKKKIKK